MAFIDEKLTKMVHHRVSWLNARAQILASNIAHADMRGTLRKDIRPFHEILNKNKYNNPLQELKISSKDSIESKAEISRDMEVLEFNRNALEHSSVTNLLKSFHSLLKTVLSLSQSGG